MVFWGRVVAPGPRKQEERFVRALAVLLFLAITSTALAQRRAGDDSRAHAAKWRCVAGAARYSSLEAAVTTMFGWRLCMPCQHGRLAEFPPARARRIPPGIVQVGVHYWSTQGMEEPWNE
jgi:hypothetical protein